MPDRDIERGPAIAVRGLSKSYRRMAAGFKMRTLKSAFLERSLTSGLSDAETIRALEGVSFDVPPGEAFGVVGGNGSGKSTLLKVIAGLLRPDQGEVVTDGRVAALIELGAGFHPEISGRQNISINGTVLGLSKKDIEERYDSIVEFSGLADYIDEPVKTYSSGMYVRLGFAVAIHTDPDILLVDEVLAVGDEEFAHRCLKRIEQHLAGGGSLLVVSHSLTLIEDLCDRCLWLERGRMREIGEPRRVIDAYRQAVAEAEGRAHREDLERATTASGVPGEGAADENDRWGNGWASITSARLLINGKEQYHLESGDEAVFEIETQAHRPLEDVVFGIAISTPRGIECWGTNTDIEGLDIGRFEGSGRLQLCCPALRLGAGEYSVDLAVHARDGTPYDYRRDLLQMTVGQRERGVGVYLPEHDWKLSGGLKQATGSKGSRCEDGVASSGATEYAEDSPGTDRSPKTPGRDRS